jgi:hypothetical protein
LKAHGVYVADQGDGSYLITRGDFVEIQILDGAIQRKKIWYFQRKLNIPIHHFWHPEAAEEQANPNDEEAKDSKGPKANME